MVIGDDPEAQLAPFSETLEVDEYCVEKVSDHDKQRMLDYYNELRQHPYTSFDKCYADNGEDWDGNRCRKNEAGEWCEYSTYNPEAKWDWYLLGGRWSGQILIIKKGATTGIVGEPAWCSKTRGIDAARKKDIDFEAMYRKEEAWAPYAVVKDGKWYARGRMGWWGVSHDNMSDEEWVAKVQELIESLPDDALVSIYDCHIWEP